MFIDGENNLELNKKNTNCVNIQGLRFMTLFTFSELTKIIFENEGMLEEKSISGSPETVRFTSLVMKTEASRLLWQKCYRNSFLRKKVVEMMIQQMTQFHIVGRWLKSPLEYVFLCCTPRLSACTSVGSDVWDNFDFSRCRLLSGFVVTSGSLFFTT